MRSVGLNFGGRAYLLETDIKELAEYVASEFGSHSQSSVDNPSLKAVVLLGKSDGGGVRFGRPHPGVNIKLKDNVLIVRYNPGLLGVLRYGFSPLSASGVLSWLAYVAVYYPLFKKYQGEGFYPVHAGLVKSGNKGTIITGKGGVGKSTMVANLVAGGNSFGGDNLVLFNPQKSEALPIVTPIRTNPGNLKNISLSTDSIDKQSRVGGLVKILPKDIFKEVVSVNKVVVVSGGVDGVNGTLIRDGVLDKYSDWHGVVYDKRPDRMLRLDRAKIKIESR